MTMIQKKLNQTEKLSLKADSYHNFLRKRALICELSTYEMGHGGPLVQFVTTKSFVAQECFSFDKCIVSLFLQCLHFDYFQVLYFLKGIEKVTNILLQD